jgi:methyl-accepting chemotaxis protein
MRLVGWLASAIGIIGIIVSNGLASLIWALKFDLQGRAHDLIAVPDVGLERAVELADSVASALADASGQIGDIKVKADAVASAPAADATAATDLATAIDGFIGGPYADFRAIHSLLRERASTIVEALHGLARAVPMLTLPGVVGERLQALDARLDEIDASMTSLAGAGADGLSQPDVAAQVAAGAATAQERIDILSELVMDLGGRMQETRDRLAERDRRIARLLTAGALVGSILSLCVAGLNVLLFQQGRRWSRR